MRKAFVILSGNHSFDCSVEGAKELLRALIDNPHVTAVAYTSCPDCKNTFIKLNGAVCNCLPEEITI